MNVYSKEKRKENWFFVLFVICLPFFHYNWMKLKFKLFFEWTSPWFLHLTEICKVVISVGLIVFGAFVAGARDLSFDAHGYAIVFLSNITTAIYLATIARVGRIPVLSYPHTVEILYLFSL